MADNVWAQIFGKFGLPDAGRNTLFWTCEAIFFVVFAITVWAGWTILGIFGNEDRAPSPEQVDQHEGALKQHGKSYEFYRYDGAGHGIFYYHRPLYRVEQALDGWSKVFSFFGKHLAA